MASISDSGGFEGSNISLKLDSKNGSAITYRYEHFSIPDRFIIRYEGKTLLDTGFVGGSSTGKLTVPKGASDIVNFIVATDNQGTAWNYSATSVSGPKDTTPLVVEPVGGDFTDPDGDGTYTFTGDVRVSVQGGGFSMLVSGTTASLKDKSVTLAGGTFQAGSRPIFAGSSEITYATQSDPAVQDGGKAIYKLGGLDLDLAAMTVGTRNVRFGFGVKLPAELGGLTVNNPSSFGNDVLVFDGSTVSLGLRGSIKLPDVKDYQFFRFFKTDIEGVTLAYDGLQEQFSLGGKITFKDFSKGVKSLAVGTSGKGITYGPNGEWDFAGSLKAETDFKIGSYGFKGFEFTIDTKADKIGLAGSVAFPFRGQTPTATLEGGFTYSPFELNKVGLSFTDINLPVWQGVFLQSIGGSVDHLSEKDTDPVAFAGSIGLSLGPAVGQYKLATGVLDVVFDADSFTGTGTTKLFVSGGDSLISNVGTYKVNWTDKNIEITGKLSVNNPFDVSKALITVDNTLKANARLDASGMAGGTLNIPKQFQWVFGGAESIAGTAYFKYVNNDTGADDYAALLAQVTVPVLGTQATGLKVTLDGDVELVGAQFLAQQGAQRTAALLLASVDSTAADTATDAVDTGALMGMAGLAAFEETRTFVLDGPSGALAMHASWDAPDPAVTLAVVNAAGQRIEAADFAANGIVVSAQSPTDVTVRVANPGAGTWSLVVGSDAPLGTFAGEAIAATAALSLSLTLPAGNDATAPYNVAWSSTGAGTGGLLSLYLDDDGVGFDGTPLAMNLALGTGAYSYAGGVKAGTYHVYGVAESGVSAPVMAYAPGTFTIAGTSDLGITGTRSSNRLSLQVANSGQAAAADAVVVLTSRSGTRPSAGQGVTVTSLGGNQYSLGLGTVAAGATRSFAISNVANAEAVSLVALTSSVDGNAANDVLDLPAFSAAAAVGDTVDLVLTRTITQAANAVGDSLGYTLSVANTSGTAATDVRIYEDRYGLTAVSANRSYVADAQLGRSYYSIGTLAPGASADVAVSARLLTAGGIVVLDEAIAANAEATPDNNVDALVIASGATAAQGIDLSIAATGPGASTVAGDQVRFSVSVANAGPGAASGITVGALLPSNFTYSSSSTVQGAYDPVTGVWDVGNIRDGVTRTLTINATATSRGAGNMVVELLSAQEPDADSTPANGIRTEDDIVALATLVGPNTAPVAAPDTYVSNVSGRVQRPAALGVLANDADPEADPLRAVLVSGPAHGRLVLNGDGSFDYRGNPGYTGPDSFSYAAQDFSFDSAAVQVSLSVEGLGTPGAPVEVGQFLAAGSLVVSGQRDAAWTGPGGTVRLQNVSAGLFRDGAVVFDPGSAAGVVGRLYSGVLGRVAATTELGYWTAQAPTLGLAAVADAIVAASALNGAAPAAFVDGLFTGVLARAPDAGEAQATLDLLQAGLGYGSAALQFASSAEAVWLDTARMGAGVFVLDQDMGRASALYDAALDRLGDAAGLLFWQGASKAGASAADLAAEFTASAEFAGRRGGMTDKEFTDSLYRSALNREADEGGRDFWAATLAGGSSRAAVVLAFVDSAEYQGIAAGQTVAGVRFA